MDALKRVLKEFLMSYFGTKVMSSMILELPLFGNQRRLAWYLK
jgi:hypothetical protein